MQEQKPQSGYSIRISEGFSEVAGAGQYEVSFRRWLVGELRSGNLTIGQAIERFKLNPLNGRTLLNGWIKRYSESHPLPLALMTEEEQAMLHALQERTKILEQRLQQSELRGVALDTLIDVAESQFNIEIRKKAGTKQ